MSLSNNKYFVYKDPYYYYSESDDDLTELEIQEYIKDCLQNIENYEIKKENIIDNSNYVIINEWDSHHFENEIDKVYFISSSLLL
jgi:hypothetical protein